MGAIDSVLGQTHRALDVVVVDDGSTDATLDVTRSYAPDVRCVALPHRGLGATRNAGVRSVRGDYIAFLDQDDIWPEQKLELQLAAFRAHPSPDLVFGHVREFISPELEPQVANRLRCVPAPRPAALPGTMLAARASMAQVGLFPTRWISNDFMAWLLAARQLGLREVMLAGHVLSRRLHHSNFSHRAGVTRSEYLHVLKQSLDRRRSDAPREATLESRGAASVQARDGGPRGADEPSRSATPP
jgi:glycosyltransferase involved in cell wall biosynthesis